jgi:hypothetical protein
MPAARLGGVGAARLVSSEPLGEIPAERHPLRHIPTLKAYSRAVRDVQGRE